MNVTNCTELAQKIAQLEFIIGAQPVTPLKQALMLALIEVLNECERLHEKLDENQR